MKEKQNSKKTIQCNLCLLKFTRTGSLKQHISKVHHVIDSTSDSEKHQTTVHERKYQLECSVEKIHADYVLKKKGKSKKTNQCNLCPLKFTRTGNLKRHISKFHDGIESVQDDYTINGRRGNLKREKKIQCDLCPMKFTRTGNLKQHISNIHEGIKPHHCSHCPARFAFKPSLKRHLIEHKSTML